MMICFQVQEKLLLYDLRLRWNTML